MKKMKLSRYIDHTTLKGNVVAKDIKKICQQAIKYDFAAVCIQPTWVEQAKLYLKDNDIKIVSVVGFPFGANPTEVKVAEAKYAVKNGADEIDMVMHIGKFLDQDYDYVVNDIMQVKKAIGNKILKVILETVYLTYEQIIKASQLCIDAHADFIKTSTGFASQGATSEVVKVMLDAAQGKIKVKAAGGVKTRQDLQKYISLGVDRIGTSSGLALISGNKADQDY